MHCIRSNKLLGHQPSTNHQFQTFIKEFRDLLSIEDYCHCRGLTVQQYITSTYNNNNATANAPDVCLYYCQLGFRWSSRFKIQSLVCGRSRSSVFLFSSAVIQIVQGLAPLLTLAFFKADESYFTQTTKKELILLRNSTWHPPNQPRWELLSCY